MDLPIIEIAEQPTLVLDDDGTPERLFSGIQARRLSDGTIVVVDRGSGELRHFDAQGRPLRRLARSGAGPGEIRGEVRLTSHKDTAFLLGRPLGPSDVQIFTGDEGFRSHWRARSDGAAGGLTLVDRLADGTLVIERGPGFRAVARLPDAGTLVPDSTTFGLLRQDAADQSGSIVWLQPVRQGWAVTYPWPREPVPTSMGPYPLGPITAAVASGDRFWLVDGERGMLRAFDGTGREVAAGQLMLPLQPLSRAQLARRRERALAAASRALDSARATMQYDAALAPRTAPLLAAAEAGVNGELWLRLFDIDDDVASQRFVIMDRNGRAVASATLPEGLDVQQIGADYMLAVRRDSLGIESVEEYALLRPLVAP